MRKRRNAPVGEITCQHPVLAVYAWAFVDGLDLSDPLAAAAELGRMSSVWKDPGRRRRALAARIALLSEPTNPQAEATADALSVAVTPPDTAATPPTVETSPLPQSRADTKPEPKRKKPQSEKPRKAARPAVDVNAAAGMFAALEIEGSGGVPDDDDPGGQRLPPEAEGKRHSTGMGRAFDDGTESDFGPREGRSLGDAAASSFEMRERSVKDEAGPAAKEHTMTDLSLSILTGSFSAPPEVDTMPTPAPEAAGVSGGETNHDDDPEMEPESKPADKNGKPRKAAARAASNPSTFSARVESETHEKHRAGVVSGSVVDAATENAFSPGLGVPGLSAIRNDTETPD